MKNKWHKKILMWFDLRLFHGVTPRELKILVLYEKLQTLINLNK